MCIPLVSDLLNPHKTLLVSRGDVDGCGVKKNWRRFAGRSASHLPSTSLRLRRIDRIFVQGLKKEKKIHLSQLAWKRDFRTAVSYELPKSTFLQSVQAAWCAARHTHTHSRLALCRDWNHIWSNLITELGHDLRNAPCTTPQRGCAHTRSQCLCQLGPAACQQLCHRQLILLGVNHIIYGH